MIDFFIKASAPEAFDPTADRVRKRIATIYKHNEDSGTTKLVGWHLKASVELYEELKAELKGRVFLYQTAHGDFKREGKYPQHVFVKTRSIVTRTDVQDPETECECKPGSEFFVSQKSREWFKVKNSKLEKMTQAELDAAKIIFEKIEITE